MGIARNIARLVPNGSGLLPNANIEAVAASKLTGTVALATQVSGTLPDANAPSGSIIQAIQATNNSGYTISGSGTFTNLSITITPLNANSRFILSANLGQVSHSSGGSTIAFAFLRNGSALTFITGYSYNGMVAFVNSSGNDLMTTGPVISHIDSPNTTSAITYTLRYECDGTKLVGRRGDGYIGASQQMQVLEIAG
jgi:hypothetical protein